METPKLDELLKVGSQPLQAIKSACATALVDEYILYPPLGEPGPTALVCGEVAARKLALFGTHATEIARLLKTTVREIECYCTDEHKTVGYCVRCDAFALLTTLEQEAQPCPR